MFFRVLGPSYDRALVDAKRKKQHKPNLLHSLSNDGRRLVAGVRARMYENEDGGPAIRVRVRGFRQRPSFELTHLSRKLVVGPQHDTHGSSPGGNRPIPVDSSSNVPFLFPPLVRLRLPEQQHHYRDVVRRAVD